MRYLNHMPNKVPNGRLIVHNHIKHTIDSEPKTSLRFFSSQDVPGNAAVDVCQAVVVAAISAGQLLMIQAEQVQHGGMQVMLRERVLHSSRAMLIGCARAEPQCKVDDD